jgi:hypothetical protein
MPFVIPLLVRYLSVNIAMANIYILSYLGGGCGEWLSYEIGKDPNYYDIRIANVTDENKFVIVDPLQEWNFSIKNPYNAQEVDVPEEIKLGVQEKYSEKNLIVPTHYLGKLTDINLSNLKGTRIRYTYNACPLFYSLLWIKTWVEPKQLNDFERARVIQCANSSPNDPTIKRESNVMDKAMEILSRGYFYSFELSALRASVRNSLDYVQKFYGFYFRYNQMPLIDYRYMDLEQLMFSPKDAVNDWQEAFGMAEPMNIDNIEEYHNKNIKVIEDTFNMSYDAWRKSKWILLLKDWVKFKCPNMY